MKLFYQTVGSGQPLVILHGLFGSADNWRSVAKNLADNAQVITVDLRNHGRSPHSSEINYSLMANDLAYLLEDLGIDNIDLIGHSVGGKVAMTFAQQYPDILNKLVVVDIAPRQYAEEHNNIFESLLAVDLAQHATRSSVDNSLSDKIPDKAVRQFLLMNLDVNDSQLNWRINLPALYANYSQLLQAVCEDDELPVKSCFIRGGRSSYIRAEDELLIQSCFPQADICTIENAGHWVHAEAPQLFLNKVKAFLDYD